MTARTGLPKRIAAAAVTALLAVSLAACAPEPTTVGQGGKDADPEQPNESSWAQPNDGVDVEQRQTELPESFPRDGFPLPEGAVIYDTGERGDGVWFLVLLAEDETAAATLWDGVIQLGGFQLFDEAETSEGSRTGTLTSTALRVTALTIPQTDGSVQLSYDLTRIG